MGTPTRTLLSLAFLLASAHLIAQDVEPGESRTFTNPLGQTVTVSRSIDVVHTTPARDWPTVEDPDTPVKQRREVRNLMYRNEDVNPDALPNGPDPALQQGDGYRVSRAPLVQFAGMNGAGIPPDPTGAAGPDRYVQAVNTSYRVFSKTGSSVAGPFSLSSLWPGSTNEGDPIVLYDRHADRWFISQFQFQPNRILIAISQTSDPAGAYFAYSFALTQFPDFPKYSVWWDGYYMTSNSSHTAVVFEREKMLLGQSAQMVVLSAPNLGNAGFRSVLPADADGPLPPAGTPCYFFNLEDDSWSGVNQDRIKIYQMNVNWTNLGSSSITTSQTLATQPFDTNFGFGFSNISQPGTTQKLDAVAQVFYFRAPYLRFVDHSSVVLCHVVDVNGADRAGIRWYELRDANNGVWAIHQQGTFAPDNANRWMASIAMDDEGNIGLGYSHTDPAGNIFPGLRYTGRLATDPLGQMTFAEQSVITGNTFQSGINRYGDYSHMSLDPDGNTFWFTGQHTGPGGNPRTRIFSFRLAQSVGIEPGSSIQQSVELTATLDAGRIMVSLTGSPDDQDLQLDVIDLQGRTLTARRISPSQGTWNGMLTVGPLAPSTYFIRAGDARFQKVVRLVVP